MRDDARQERKRREMKSARLFSIAILVPSICYASPQSVADLEAAVQQRIGKRIEINRDVVADEEIERAVRTMLRGTLTADRAVQIALLNNRELQATFEDIGIANSDLIEAGLLKNPAFNAGALFPDRPPSAAKLDFGLTQEFLDLLMIPLRKKVAANELMRTKLRVGDAVLKLAGEVKSAFYTLQGKQMLFTRLGVLSETNAATLELALRQHEAGNISDLELANQQSTYSQSKLDAAQVAAEMRSDREKLNRLMGAWGTGTEWKVADELPSLPASFPTEHLESLAMDQRLDLTAAKAELGAIVQSLGLTKTYRYVGAIEFGVSSERETDRQWMAGPTLRLELPIFNRGQGRIARLKAQLRQAERRLEAAAIDIRSEVREARDRALAKKDLAAYYRDELVPERKRVLDLTLTSYNSMLKGPYDLLLARQNELAAERGYIDALRDYWIARADLERAVGGRQTSTRPKMQDSSKETRTH